MRNFNYYSVFCRRPDATACIKGNDMYPCIRGEMMLYQLCDRVMITVETDGLPMGEMPCGRPVFAFHIHDNEGHYNPDNCIHPYHAGDMPPLFGVNGSAFLAFVTAGFTVDEVLGKMVVVHEKRDDFSTQPSGDPGEKIACGVIVRACR